MVCYCADMVGTEMYKLDLKDLLVLSLVKRVKVSANS